MTRATLSGLATSLKTTVVLLCLLAVLLFLNVVVPQERVIGEEGFSEIVDSSPLAHLVLVRLGFGHLAVSRFFLLFLGVFFIHLTAVLVKRTGITVRRTRLRPPSITTLRIWTENERAVRGSAPEPIELEHVLTVLKGFGFRAVPVATSAAWSVKHRTAPIGFVLFHISFFLICLGGAMIYATRFVGTARVVEGHPFTGFTTVIREAPLAGPPDLSFSVHGVEMQFENGQPVHLSAELRFRGPAGGMTATTRINHPARSGDASIMINRAGVAPQIWLQDREGFTLDRIAIAAATLSGRPTIVPFADGAWVVEVRPLVDRSNFPTREQLAETAIEISVFRGDALVFAGALRPGQDADLGDAVLVLEKIGYWAGLYVVSERGGGPLIAGFVLGIVGLVWRLMFYRREVAIVWDGTDFAVCGRAEYFSHRFRQEIDTIAEYVKRSDRS